MWQRSAAGRMTTIGDVTGLTGYSYDAAGRQTEVALPLGVYLTYAYDPVGNRSTLLDQSSGTTTYSYDARNLLHSVLNPFAETTTWVWDALGRQQQQLLANGVTASHAYDAAGRASDLAYYQSDGTPVAIYTATYDAAGNRTAVDELGGTFTYTYDASNQLASEQRTSYDPDDPRYHYAYQYDGVGNRRLLDQGAQVVSYSYNAADELTLTQSLVTTGVTHTVALQPLVRPPFSRDAFALELPLPAGRWYTVEQASVNLVGATGTWDNENLWQVDLQSRTPSLGVASTLATSTFATAGAGMVELAPGLGVDPAETPVLSVALHKVGAAPNLLAAAASVRLAELADDEQTSYAYDANGNTILEAGPARTVTYTWDGENRLLQVADDGGTETYTYAATGLRRSKVTDSGTTEFVWDGVNVLAELDGSLADVARYTDWPGSWGGLSSARRSGSSQFFGFDLSANTRALLDASEAVTDDYLYSAFGTELAAGASANALCFGGQLGYYSDLAEKVYVRARHFRPAVGRWLTTDSVRSQPRYPYARSNPLVLLDPGGAVAEVVVIEACAAALGAPIDWPFLVLIGVGGLVVGSMIGSDSPHEGSSSPQPGDQQNHMPPQEQPPVDCRCTCAGRPLLLQPWDPYLCKGRYFFAKASGRDIYACRESCTKAVRAQAAESHCRCGYTEHHPKLPPIGDPGVDPGFA